LLKANVRITSAIAATLLSRYEDFDFGIVIGVVSGFILGEKIGHQLVKLWRHFHSVGHFEDVRATLPVAAPLHPVQELTQEHSEAFGVADVNFANKQVR
jgi:hypothetical protein